MTVLSILSSHTSVLRIERLRPDQRAFELGLYDLANELKQAQEEKQRGIRKAREREG